MKVSSHKDRFILIDGGILTVNQIILVSRMGYKVKVNKASMKKVIKSRNTVENILKSNEAFYGINTGVGKFVDVRIGDGEEDHLQQYMIRSHSCGLGEPFQEEIVRAAILIKANMFLKGYSGVRPIIIETLVDILNKGLYPYLPKDGSGVSGDIIPSAHLALAMMGEGKFITDGGIVEGSDTLTKNGIKPIEFRSKEGLAVLNGTQISCAMGTICIHDVETMIKSSDIAAALSMEALNAVRDALNPATHELRPHRGQINTAENITRITEGSRLLQSHSTIKIQDAFSLRCIPQVHGIIKDGYNFVRGIVETEINSVTDNPIVFGEDNKVMSGGNFHAEYLGVAMDYLCIVVSEIGTICERRVERLVNPSISGLPGFLTYRGGLQNGLMVTQYAAASLVSQNKRLANPASVDSISCSANQEDFVSMSTLAAKKAYLSVQNAFNIVAIEMLAACQGLEFRNIDRAGKGTDAAYTLIRSKVEALYEDRPFHADIECIASMIKNRDIVDSVEAVVSSLTI